MQEYIEQEIPLLFDEPSHVYTNGNTGERFTSVTTLIGKYEETFNDFYWSMYSALKAIGVRVRPDMKNNLYIGVNGIDMNINTLYANKTYAQLADNMLKSWDKETKKSHVRGNTIHNKLEDTINISKGDINGETNELIKPLKGISTKLAIMETKHDLDRTDLELTYPEIYTTLLTFINQGCTLIAEKKIYTSRFMIAGMIDVLVVKGKMFAIVDWKTNKDELMFISGYYKKVKVGNDWVKGNEFIQKDIRLKEPLNNLQECKGIMYSLQLSLYAFIMELWGYTLIPNGLMIFHIRPRRKPLRLNIKYYKSDIGRMLEHHNKQRLMQTIELKENKGVFGLGIN